MSDREVTSVLIIHSSKLQAELWQMALASQKVSVILESPEVSLHEITGVLARSVDSIPTLLLVDLGMRHLNGYELCRWCQANRPDLKLVLTSGLYEQIYSSPVRQWAIEQGADELLPAFDLNYLTSSILMCLDRVLGILQQQIPDKEALIAALITYCKENRLNMEADGSSYESRTKTPISLGSSLTYSGKSQISLKKVSEPYLEPTEKFFLDVQEPNILTHQRFDVQESEPSQATIPQGQFLLWGEMPKWLYILLGIIVLGLLTSLAGYLGSQYAIHQLAKKDVDKPTHATQQLQSKVDLPSGLFTYGGSTTWARIQKQVLSALAVTAPQFQLRYTDSLIEAPGSTTGIQMLLAGELDFALSSRPLKAEEYATAKTRGFTLVQYPVAIDGVAVVVHPSLKLSGLTLSQLQQIYRGEITNWQELGGPELPIIPLSRQAKESGTASYFQENVLQDQPFSDDVMYARSTTEAIQKLKRLPGSVYYASTSTVMAQCQITIVAVGKTSKSLVLPSQRASESLAQHCPNQNNQVNVQAFTDGSYPLTRKLYVIVKKDQTSAEQAGEAYAKFLLSEPGQAAIAEAGFVRIR